MKKIISISILLLALSCTNNQNDTNKPTPSTTPSTPPPQVSTTPSPTPVDAKDAIAAAQQMYTLHFKEKQLFDVTHYKEWIDPQLYSLIIKDQEESAKFTNEVAGLDFNPITYAQEEVGQFTITAPKASDHEADVNVVFTEDLKSNVVGANLTLKMVKNGDKWQIKNILYPSGETDLIKILGEIEKERNELKKSSEH